jgi:hypothetical protein
MSISPRLSLLAKRSQFTTSAEYSLLRVLQLTHMLFAHFLENASRYCATYKSHNIIATRSIAQLRPSK